MKIPPLPNQQNTVFCIALLSHAYVFYINISKVQTEIWDQSLHGKREMHTLHGHRSSSEKIFSVEYAALTIVFQGHVFPTEAKSDFVCFYWIF